MRELMADTGISGDPTNSRENGNSFESLKEP
jgi:hypothetical protein